MDFDGILYDASEDILIKEDYYIPTEKELKQIEFEFKRRESWMSLYENITKVIDKIGVEELIREAIKKENGYRKR